MANHNLTAEELALVERHRANKNITLDAEEQQIVESHRSGEMRWSDENLKAENFAKLTPQQQSRIRDSIAADLGLHSR